MWECSFFRSNVLNVSSISIAHELTVSRKESKDGCLSWYWAWRKPLRKRGQLLSSCIVQTNVKSGYGHCFRWYSVFSKVLPILPSSRRNEWQLYVQFWYFLFWIQAYASRGYIAVAIDSRYHGERATNTTTYRDVRTGAFALCFCSSLGYLLRRKKYT